MKKNEKNASKNVAGMMRKVEKKDLQNAAGGVLPPHLCLTCGLVITWI